MTLRWTAERSLPGHCPAQAHRFTVAFALV